MRLFEIEEQPKPHLYLDMDGVQADFFGAWARFEQVHHYKHITDPEDAILRLAAQGPDAVENFFATLEPLAGGQQIINWLKQHRIPFTVLSAPLRKEGEASIRGKRTWLDRYNAGTSSSAIFTSAKYKYAKKGGQANVLVDDFGKYINAWRDAGGIGIKHEDSNTDATIKQLAEIYGVKD